VHCQAFSQGPEGSMHWRDTGAERRGQWDQRQWLCCMVKQWVWLINTHGASMGCPAPP
jgi:hypothetical protein